MNIFTITKEVRTALLANSELASKVGQQVFCLDAKENIQMPFITVQKLSAEDVGNKDCISFRNCEIVIGVFATSYKDSCEIASLVYDAMDDNFNQTRNRAIMVENTEDCDIESGVYWQTLTYQFVL